MCKLSQKISSLFLSLCLIVTLTGGGFPAAQAASLSSEAVSVSSSGSVLPDSATSIESSSVQAVSSLSEADSDLSIAPSVSVSSETENSSPESDPPAPPVPNSEALAPAAVQEQAFSLDTLLALARTDGAQAALLLNAVTDDVLYITSLKSVLNIYYTEDVSAQLPAFSSAIDARATETLAFYAAAAAEREQAFANGYLPGEVLVVFGNTPTPEIEAVAEKQDAAIVNTVQTSTDEVIAVAEIALDQTVQQAVENFEAEGLVTYAQPNFIYLPTEVYDEPAAISTTDPNLGSQWYLNAINLEGAWNILKTIPPTADNHVLVSVIDTGCSVGHADLAGSIDIARSADFSLGVQMPHTEPPQNGDWWHGTHVIGTIAAQTNNAVGVAGLVNTPTNNNIAKVMSLNVFFDYNGNQVSTSRSIIAAINYSVEQGARVINMSLGHEKHMGADDVLLETSINTAVARGTVVVAAAGNKGNTVPNFPSDFTNTIGVVATNSAGRRASFSNYGTTKNIAAPGERIFNTVTGNGYAIASGTSMASPIVAGVAAMVLYANPDMSAAQVAQLLTSTASNATFNTETAWGIVNAQKAVQEAAKSAPNAKRSIALNTSSMTVYLRDSAQLFATVTPATADQSILWVSKDPEIATVSATGVVSGVAVGSTTVTAALNNGRVVNCTVSVSSPVLSVRAGQKNLQLAKGKSASISAVVYTANNSATPVTWRSNKPSIARVSQNGRITGVRTGSATLTISAENGKKTTISVKVVPKNKNIRVSSVSVSKTPKTIDVGKSKYISAKVKPSTATGARITYKSSKPAVLYVDAAGKLTAKKKGTAKITVSAGGKRRILTIRVK